MSKDDSLYDFIAHQDCLPQPEPEDEPQKVADAAALRVARDSYKNTKMLLEAMGVKIL